MEEILISHADSIGYRLATGLLLCMVAEVNTMTHTQSVNTNSVHKSLMPMLLTWTRCISWTVLLSALLAVLFALMIDGCSGIH